MNQHNIEATHAHLENTKPWQVDNDNKNYSSFSNNINQQWYQISFKQNNPLVIDLNDDNKGTTMLESSVESSSQVVQHQQFTSNTASWKIENEQRWYKKIS